MAKLEIVSPSRFHVDYWKSRLYRNTFTRAGKRHVVSEFSVRLQHLGRREAFSLATTNASAAAVKAKEIATFLEANGWDATLAKFKPKPTRPIEVCTLGEFLSDVQIRSHLKAKTVRRYAVKLRKLISDIAGLEKNQSRAATKKKYDYVNGGRAKWLERVDAQRIDVLTDQTIQGWRNEYVTKWSHDPVRAKSAERSAASYLRCVRALFAPEITSRLTVTLPTNPFAGMKLKDPGAPRYRSDIDAQELLDSATAELRVADVHQYLALVLCLVGGLRRREADLLMWEQVDLERAQIHIRRTKYFEPKTEESQRSIDLPAFVCRLLQSLKASASSEFVLTGGEPKPTASYDYYRCDSIWRPLNAWLKGQGVTDRKAIHSLRKESGSIIAAAHGIEAARGHLGHRDIRTTSSHYVTKKNRVEVSLKTEVSFV